MKLQRQHFLLSYLKTLSRTLDLTRDSPVLNQLSHRCAVNVSFIAGSTSISLQALDVVVVNSNIQFGNSNIQLGNLNIQFGN